MSISNPNINPEKPRSPEKNNYSNQRADVALDLVKKPNTTWEWVQEKTKLGKERLEKEVNDAKWIPTLLKSGLLILGAVEGYRLYHWAFDSEPNGKEHGDDEESKSSTFTHLGLGSLLGLAAVALYIKKNFGFEPVKEQIIEAAKEIKQGAFQKGMDLLHIHPETELWTNTSRELGVRAGQISQLGQVPWEQFKSHWEGQPEKSYFRIALEKVGLASQELSDEEIKSEIVVQGEEQRLWSHINKYIDQIEITKEDTVESILTKIEAFKEQMRENNPAPKMLETMDEVRAEFAHTAEAISSIDKAKDTAELAANLVVASTKDGAGLLVNNAGTFVVKYGVMAPITNLQILGETITDVMQMGIGVETPQGVLANYFRNTGYYIGIGALSGGAIAAFTQKSIVWSMGKGAMWGLIAPVKFYDVTVKSARLMGLGAERVEGIARSFESWSGVKSGDPEQIARAVRAKTLYHATSIKNILSNEEWYKKIPKGELLKHLSLLPQASQTRIIYHLRNFLNGKEEFLKKIGEVDGGRKIHIADFEKGTLSNADLEETIDEFIKEHSGADIGAFKFKSKLSPERVQAGLDEAATQSEKIKKIEGLSKSVDDMEGHFKTHLDEIDQLRHQGVNEAEIETRSQAVQKLGQESRATLETEIKKLTSEVSTMSEAEKIAFSNLISKMNRGRVVRGFLKENLKARGVLGAKVCLVIGGARAVWGAYEMSKEDAENQNYQELYELGQEVGVDTLELALNILCPFGLLDFYSIWNGTDLQGNELGIWQKTMYGLTGTFSLVSDTVAAASALATAEFVGSGGAAVYGAANALETGLRAGGKAPEVIAAVKKILPRLQQLAQNSGGYKKLIEMLISPRMKTALKWSGRGMMGAQAAALGYTGLQIAYDTSNSEVIEIPEEIAKNIQTPALEEGTSEGSLAG